MGGTRKYLDNRSRVDIHIVDLWQYMAVENIENIDIRIQFSCTHIGRGRHDSDGEYEVECRVFRLPIHGTAVLF